MRSPISDSEKAQKIESQRRIAAARTPQERAVFNEYHRQWQKRKRAEMTDEERLADRKRKSASKARAFANLSPERKDARRRYQSRWMAAKRASDRTADRRQKRAWVLRKRSESPEFVLEQRLRGTLNKAVRRYGTKEIKPRTMEVVGCTRQELRRHLESQFKPGMSWDNYGYRGWHIDHVKPIASFNLLYESATSMGRGEYAKV